ncbi:MAG: ABC transporter permease [Pseudobdellovibrionaceae bacterium]
MKRILKYSRLMKAFFKASFVADLEYRANFATRILTDIIWYAAQVLMFEALFRVTDTIGSWNLAQTRVFLGVLFVVDAFYMIFFSENLDHMSDKVRKGEIDLLLAKPVSSQFMVSLQRINTAIFGNLLIGLVWLYFALSSLPDFQWIRLLWLLLLIPAGLLSLYSIRFMFCSLAMLFTRADNIQYLWFQLYRLGMRPDSIYVPWLKVLVLTILPVAVVASVPSRALLDPPHISLFVFVSIWSIGLVYLSHRFWNYCLRHYSSASS